MKILFLMLSCLLALPLAAQNAPRNRVPSGGLPQTEESPALKKNITIRLHGTTTTGAEVDLSLSGIGPRFTADQVVNDDTMLTCQYVVSGTETGYQVSYSIGARVKVLTQANPNGTGFEYRDVTIQGTVLCSDKKPQVLVQSGTKTLNLTIAEDA